jgi:plastocyanin
MRAWIGLVLVGLVASCGDDTTTTTGNDMANRDMSTPLTASVAVGMGGNNFNPQNVTIKVGGTVTWNWQGSGTAHTVTSGTSGVADGKFCNGTTTPSVSICSSITTNPEVNSGSFSFTFPTAGSYPYYCRPHVSMGMTGTVNVVP